MPKAIRSDEIRTPACVPVDRDGHELVQRARVLFSRDNLALLLPKHSAEEIRRWEQRKAPVPREAADRLRRLFDPKPEVAQPAFTFIDLFAGIGGFRLGFEAAGGKCVWTSEWDSYAQQTYVANHGQGHPLIGDIRSVENVDEMPHCYDVLLAGFPCQPFSIAGVSKKNALGRPHGFDCETQGTLFFDIERIIDATRPAAFVLENVKNLKSHDKGNTYAVIMRALRKLGYHVPEPRIIDARHWVPQHRERIFIVGFREDVDCSLADLVLPTNRPTLSSVLHRLDGTEPYLEHDGNRFFDHNSARVQDKYTLTEGLWSYLQNYAIKHQAAGNGFGFGLVQPQSTTRTLSARYYKDGSEILVDQGADTRPRRLTPRECARLMGFPDSFEIAVSDTRAYKQFGNAVVATVTEAIARHIAPAVAEIRQRTQRDQRAPTVVAIA